MHITDRQTDAARIELWFDFASHYSYLAVMRIEDAAAARGVGLEWRPFVLGAIFRSYGWVSSPFVLHKEKGEYAWLDVARQCRKLGLPWTRPSRFPRPALLPLRVALLGAEEAWIGDFCRRIMRLNFAEDRDIDAVPAVAEALEGLGLPAAALIEEAQAQPNKFRLREQTERARQRSVFGAPTFFAGAEMFWGNDRLDDALDACLARIAAAT